MVRHDKGVLPGTVDLVILRTLLTDRQHGFAISRSLRRSSEGIVDLGDAALYQALHRMERSGWIQSEWGVSEKGRRAKYYGITTAGREQLEKEERYWRRYSAAVFRILETPARGG